MIKALIASATSLAGLALACLMQPPPPPGGPPPHEKAEKAKKGAPGPEGELRRAYDLLHRLRADSGSGRPEERLRDWTDRATKFYREGVKAFQADDRRQAHEYGLAAHDLARAVDHARHAAEFEKPDAELPPPPEGRGPEGEKERVRRDLRHAHDRIQDGRDDEAGAEGKFYLDAARDLYRAARRDAEAGRDDRAGELARAAEAMTHVPEHLARATDRGPEPKGRDGGPPPPDPKGERRPPHPRPGDGPPPDRKGDERPERKADRKADRDRDRDRPGDELPPPL